MANAIALELMRIRRHKHLIAHDLTLHNLADDILVREADHQAVLGRIVLVLGLGDEALAGVVVGLAGSAALVLHLVAAVGTTESVAGQREM